MAKMKVQEVEGREIAPLYHRYSMQNQPQSVYVEVDFDNGIVMADWNAEIGNGIPFSVFHGHCQRWDVSKTASKTELNDLLEELLPWAEQAAEGYESEWDGSNFVASFSEDAQECLEMIESRIVDNQHLGGDVIIVECWSDWFVNTGELENTMSEHTSMKEFVEDVEETVRSEHILDTDSDLEEFAIDRITQEIEDCDDEEELEECLADYPGWIRDQEKISKAITEQYEEFR